ncbi:MAG: MOSC domain-containing protein [Mycobacterium sp.]|nr:MOSC domain-containing protein [Mycobacterium sp.]
MATLVSVNVGLPKNVAWNGRTVYTGVWKQPVVGPRMVRRLNVDGDGQGDLGGHGGENRAVLVYQLDSYRYWSHELHRDDLQPGHFGENFTVEGLPDDGVCIGDRYRIGQAVFEVSQPRVTCYRVGLRLGEPQMAALLVSHRRPGFYFRVITEGEIEAGQDIVKVGSGPEQVSVAEIDALLYLPGHPRDALERALRIPALSSGWKGSLQNLLTQAGTTSTSAGNTGLTAAASNPPPAWAGFRPLKVTAVHEESRTVRSITLADPDGASLPPWRPGQSIAVRLSRDDTHETLIRNYSLSNWAGTGNYRIGVKRETHGVASTYIHSHVAVGDILEVAAPRGTFFLTATESPIILLSAGVGVTPVLSMLHTLAATESPRQVWWLHAARDQSQHPFASESRALLNRLSNSHIHVFYSRPEPAEQLPADAEQGHLSAATIARLGLPSTGNVYLCGPASFMDDVSAELLKLGFEYAQIHTETFGATAALTPGIAAAAVPPHLPVGPPGPGPQVQFARSGITAPFGPPATTLLEFGEECDVPVQWACRTGVCHSCETALISGTVDYTLEPLEPPAPGNILLCCSRPAEPVVVDL